jgi:hypothetical protein
LNGEGDAVPDILLFTIVLAHTGGTQEVANEDLRAEGEVLAHQVLRALLFQVLKKDDSAYFFNVKPSRYSQF